MFLISCFSPQSIRAQLHFPALKSNVWHTQYYPRNLTFNLKVNWLNLKCFNFTHFVYCRDSTSRRKYRLKFISCRVSMNPWSGWEWSMHTTQADCMNVLSDWPYPDWAIIRRPQNYNTGDRESLNFLVLFYTNGGSVCLVISLYSESDCLFCDNYID